MLCWVDIETTGLDPQRDRILELGIVLTTNDLDEVGRKSWICRWLGERERLNPYVRAMHERSGLLDECERSEDTLALVETEVIAFLLAEGEKHQFCGSSVHFDRSFLQAQAPGLMKLFGYRNIDVSTLTELCRRWNPHTYERRPGAQLSKEEMPHRALADLDASIALLRYYRDRLFVEEMEWVP